MWILDEIEAQGGEIGFERFMELALYHPQHGYYNAASTPWGRDGDFLTAPSVSRWYASVVARLLRDVAGRSGRSTTLVDLAAGDGSFLAGVLDALGAEADRVAPRVIAVERSPARRRFLGGIAPSVEARATLDRTGGPTIVHASELYDAMPVYRVQATSDGLMEHTVVIDGNRPGWSHRPARSDLVAYLAGHGIELEEGQVAEINLTAGPFHRRVLDAAGEGLALILDYGYPARRLYDPRGRRGGSLATYSRHELGRNPLDAPGEQDLTAHVNWDDLRRAADVAGWFEIGIMPLAEFLVRAGIGDVLEENGYGIEAELDAETYAARQQVKQLLDPEGMGSDLKMLVQGRGEVGEAAAETLNREL